MIPDLVYYIQYALFGFTTIFLVLVFFVGLNGVTQTKMFERKHYSLLRFVISLTYLNFLIALALELTEFFLNKNISPNQVLGIEIMLLFFAGVCATLGIGKVRSSLIHGKKFKTVVTYFGLTLLIMLAIGTFIFLVKYEGLVF